jgi:energy-coupling factor transporter ATP-binding protein EcfA2
LKPYLQKDGGELRLRSDSKNLMHQNFELTNEELDAVSFILGKHYLSARVMDHSLYGGARGISVYFRNALGAGYSEAFAGSGEMSVVNLVTRLCRDVTDNALILLDEPEVSLHPGAQERLLIFLMDQVKRRHHQVIFSSHSPAMIRHLPARAIKVFVEGEDGRFDVIGNVDAKTAFAYLGEPLKEKINVYVEDGLAQKIVQLVLRKKFSVQEANRYMIDVQPGGAKTYFSARIPTLMTRPEHIFFLLDGDMQPKDGFKDPAELSEQYLREHIDELIFAATGVKSVNLGSDGGDDPDASAKHFERKKEYLRYLKDHVEFLPQPSPEHIILSAMKEPEPSNVPAKAKAKLSTRIAEIGVAATNKEIEAAAATLMFTKYDASDPNVLAIEKTLRNFLAASSGS